MALLRYVVVVATVIETWWRYPLLLDLCHVSYIFKVRQHENNESNNHNLWNVVWNNSMWYTLGDPESSVNWKLTKRPITYHYCINHQHPALIPSVCPLIIGFVLLLLDCVRAVLHK
jgi:hypothetical protein